MSPLQELGKLRPQLVRFAMRRLRDRHRAEDVVQDALVAALEGMERYGGASSLATWVTAILKHKIVDTLRAAPRHEPLDYDGGIEHYEHPESELARRRAWEAVHAGLKQLPGCAAQVFVMRELLGISPAEVSRQLGISSSNCSVIHHRVRVRLRGSPRIRALAADAL